MGHPKTILTICLYLISLYALSVFAAHKTACRTQARKFGYCALYENCPALHNAMLFSEMFNNRYCENSGLIGAVVCCPSSTNEHSRILKPLSRSTTTTTPATTTTTSTTTQPTSKAVAHPSCMDTRENSIISESQNLNPNGLAILNKYKCGRILSDRVANGVDAGLDELPWVAMLLYGAPLKSLCDGSVIADRWVLTAAHCIRNDLNRVRLGEHTVSTERDCATAEVCVTYKDFGIEKSIKHPQYDATVYYKDIALIKLNEAIEFQSQSADVLQKGLLALEQLDVCKSTYSRYLVDDSKICTRAGANDTVSCRGDSGGPLFWKTRFRTARGYYRERYAQIGVVSTGYMYKCGGLTKVPFMFENVTNSMIWLTNAILN
ncbi:serine protease grass-like isoform X2 [Eurosta solidaginis]|uniref:serine protease grass-like isoform X2 n=1 Tax=Eurosta solidaginis TaxID=178769 RepID=UPI00353158D8